MRTLARSVIGAPVRFAEVWIAPGAKSFLGDRIDVHVRRIEETAQSFLPRARELAAGFRI